MREKRPVGTQGETAVQQEAPSPAQMMEGDLRKQQETQVRDQSGSRPWCATREAGERQQAHRSPTERQQAQRTPLESQQAHRHLRESEEAHQDVQRPAKKAKCATRVVGMAADTQMRDHDAQETIGVARDLGEKLEKDTGNSVLTSVLAKLLEQLVVSREEEESREDEAMSHGPIPLQVYGDEESREDEAMFYGPNPLQTYDGSEDFSDYMVQFKAIASLKSWSQKQKATILLGRLKGSALSVAATLGEPTYDQLVEHLKSHFGPRHAESYAIQLSAREQQKGESLSEFAHAIRKLTRGAYPDLDARAQDRLARERFVAGISDSHVRTKLRDLRPQTMPKALEEARILSENKEAEKQRTRRVGWTCGEVPPQQPPAPLPSGMAPSTGQATSWPAPQPLDCAPPPVTAPSTDLVAPLQELVRHLRLQQQQPNQQASYGKPRGPPYRGQQQARRRAPATSTTQCWQCQQYGHYSRECPVKQATGRGGPQARQISQAAPPPPPQHNQPQGANQQSSTGVPPLMPAPPVNQQQMSFPVMSLPMPSLPPHQPVMFQPQLQPASMDFAAMYGNNSGTTQKEASSGVPQPGNGSGQQ